DPLPNLRGISEDNILNQRRRLNYGIRLGTGIKIRAGNQHFVLGAAYELELANLTKASIRITN
ncbi:MAG: hypothetical protein AAF206_25490, partial [Bacteroidota bacterium]